MHYFRSSRKKYLTVRTVLSQKRIIIQVRFIYILLGKAMEKQEPAIEDQR